MAEVELELPCRYGPRYVLLKKLGEGGMGSVFLAVTGQRVCALKLLRSSETNPEVAKRLVDEGRLATKLSHQNVVYAFDSGVVEETPYVALEYLRGKTLYETLTRGSKTGTRLPIGLIFYITKEILRGLEYLHNVDGLRLVHRDLSPANVMVTYDGAVKIIDLGVAHWVDRTSATMTGENWGQDRYKSPEQYAGDKVDRRSDIFAVGVLLWEMLTRKRLFDKNSARDPNASLPAPSTFIPGLSQEVDALVMTALARNPSHRFQDAKAFIKDLALHIEPDDDAAALQAFMSKAFETDIVNDMEEESALVRECEGAAVAQPSRRWVIPAATAAASFLVAIVAFVWIQRREELPSKPAPQKPVVAIPTDRPTPPATPPPIPVVVAKDPAKGPAKVLSQIRAPAKIRPPLPSAVVAAPSPAVQDQPVANIKAAQELLVAGERFMGRGDFEAALQAAMGSLETQETAKGYSLLTRVYLARNQLIIAERTVDRGLRSFPQDDFLAELKLDLGKRRLPAKTEQP